MPAERQQARGAVQAANLPLPLPLQPLLAGQALLAKHGDSPLLALGEGGGDPAFGGVPVSMSQEGARHRAGLWLRQADDDLRAGTQLLAWATEELG
jgi:hypothetical protein